MKAKISIFMIAASALFISCSDDDSNTLAPPPGTNLSLSSLSGLERLEGQHYEGWVIINEAPVTTGRFNINAEGQVISVDTAGAETGVISSTDVGFFTYEEGSAEPTAFVLTIEPDGDTDPAPSEVHLVAGDFDNNAASATVDHQAAIGTAFGSAAGTYILAAPTSNAVDDNQGLWFLSLSLTHI